MFLFFKGGNEMLIGPWNLLYSLDTFTIEYVKQPINPI